MPKKISGRAHLGRWLLALSLILSCAIMGPGAQAKDGWRPEGLPGQFRCEIPQDWRPRDTLAPRGEISKAFGDGRHLIRVAYFGNQGPGPKTPKEYLTWFETGHDRRFVQGESLTISGRAAQRWSRRYQVRPQTRRGSRPESWIFDEVFFLEGPQGFWALRFSSSAPVFRPEPGGLAIWQRFLKSFKLL